MAQMAASGYSPNYDEVNVGSNITWSNQDRVAHTVSSQDKNQNATSSFDSGNIDPGEQWSHIFDQKGVYNYYDKLHTYIMGTINVTTTSTNSSAILSGHKS
jgi:plastocyanin